MPDVSRTLPVGPDAAWDALVDLDAWPDWGPSVRGATLDDGARRLHRTARGRVRTAVGLELPFEVTGWEDGRRWAWTVGGVAATGHRVAPAADGCRVTIEVPWWAFPYLSICWWAIGRIGAAAAD